MQLIETVAVLLLEEVTRRFQLQVDGDGNVYPVWPSPAEIVHAVAGRMEPAPPEPMMFTPAQGVQFSTPA